MQDHATEKIAPPMTEKLPSRTECATLLPLSSAQRRMYFWDKLVPDTALYNLTVLITITGDAVDGAAIVEALRALVQRHDALRSRIVLDGTEPWQKLDPKLTISPQSLSLRHLARDEQEGALSRIIDEESRRPFDLEREPGFRAHIFDLSRSERCLLWTFHHGAADGWSITRLWEEFCTLYGDLLKGQQQILPPVPMTFAEYVELEQSRLQSGVRERELAYWRQLFSELPEPLQIATDRARPVVSSYRGGRVPIVVDPELFSCMRAQAKSLRMRITPFMVILAAWQLLLHLYSGQNLIVVGSAIANRRNRKLATLVGYLANTIALPIDFSKIVTVRDLLVQVREIAVGASAHAQVPFEDVVEALQVTGQAHQLPLIHSMLVFEPKREDRRDLGAVTVQARYLDTPVARMDLALVLYEGEDELNGAIEYDVDLFDESTIVAMAAHFRAVLQALTRSLDTPLAQIDLLSPDERATVLSRSRVEICDEVGHAPDIAELIATQAQKHPNAIAVRCGDGQLSYAELERRAQRVAAGLRERGAGPEVLVALCLQRSCDLIVAMLGILKAGAAYVPLDPAAPTERLRSLLADCTPALIISHGDAPDLTKSLTQHVDLSVLEQSTSSQEVVSQSHTHSREQLAYVIYTSGSTGQPKGVMVTRGNLAVSIAARRTYYREKPSRLLVTTAFTFDAGPGFAWWALTTGGTVVLPDAVGTDDASSLLRIIHRERVTHLVAVTSSYAVLLSQENRDALNSIEYAIVGGEVLSAKLAVLHNAILPHAALYNEYGPTEATVWSTVQKVADAPTVVPIGRAAPHAQLYVLDAAGRPVPPGVAGELYIGGPGVARGYLRAAEQTERAFVPNPFVPGERLYRTGDMVRQMAEGTLMFLGRRDAQVKIRGTRVELNEVEQTLATLPGVRRLAVVVVDQNSAPSLFAFVEPIKNVLLSPDVLREQARMRLPAAMVPSGFVMVDHLPELASGKIDRRALANMRPGAREARVEPRGAIEQVLWEAWREVLRIDDFGVHDNFFALGGHSLQATQVVARARQLLKVDLPLRALFDAPTIAGLASRAEQLMQKGQSSDEPSIPVLARESALPVSFSQRRMWFVQQFEPQGTAYNMPFALRLKGPVNHLRLAQALAALIKRHEAFRTSFSFRGGEPVQVVSQHVSSYFHEVDLRDLPLERRVPETIRLFREESQRPFDLQSGPLFRFLLVQLDAEDHALLWLVHHAICDQWSAGIMSRELAMLYRAQLRGEQARLAPLPIQYADFAAWQRAYYTPERLNAQLDYWRQKLAGISSLSLPTDWPRPARQTFRGSRVTATLSASTVAALKQLTIRTGATQFMVLLACFKLLLRRYSGQEDIAVGSPIANRTRVATESLVGTLVNTLVMRTDLSGDPTFNDLIGRVRDTALEAYAHQDLPFEQLVEEIVGNRDPGQSPLVQVLFNVPNAPMNDFVLDGLQYELFDFDYGSAQFDLSLSVETEIFRRVDLSYSTDLFSERTAEQLLGHYVRLLERVVRSPNRSISEYTLLDQVESQTVLESWNQTAVQYDLSLRAHELVTERARYAPSAIALRMGRQAITYGELELLSNRLAHYLRARGVGRETIVGVCLERSTEMVVALLAIMKADAAYVPLDPAFPPDRLQFMVEDANPLLVITQQKLVELLPNARDRLACLDELHAEISAYPSDRLPVCRDRSPSDLAYVLYTSGSTGKPKGVEIPHRALTNFLFSMLKVPGCAQHDTLLAVTTLSFDIAGLELYLPLIAGACVYIASTEEARDAQLLRQRILACKPTIMQATPATWRMLIEAGWTGLSGLKILCGGEALPRELANDLLQRCAELWNVYGPTETTIWSTLDRITDQTSAITIGRPIANTRVYVLDQRLRPVPVGVAGELFIGGDGVARGYRNRAELTRERFISSPFVRGDRLYRTGDLARFQPDGRLVHLGRLDFQVKIRGFRIELGEIETALRTHSAVQQAIVTARADRSGVNELVAYIVPGGEVTPTPTELREHLRKSLPSYMLPSYFMFLAKLPLTSNNKTDVRALPAPTSEHQAVDTPRVPPRTELEMQLAVLWQQVLGVSQIGIHDNFFELGGHSLKAAQLFADLELVFGKRLPLNELYRAPTIASMAALLSDMNWRPNWSSLVALRPAGSAPPLFMVPGVGGNVLMFADFVKHVGADQPVYGLQARGLNGIDEPFTSISKAAAYYVEEIRTVRPRGPYVLVGVCTGGVIAYEMAQQLVQADERVILVLVDTWHPSSHRTTKAMPWAVALVFSRMVTYLEMFKNAPISQWPRIALEKLRSLRSFVISTVKGAPQNSTISTERVTASTYYALSKYDVRTLPIRLLNVVASQWPFEDGEVDTRAVWTELSGPGSKTIQIEAKNSGRMFFPPHVENLICVVTSYVDEELRRGDDWRLRTSRMQALRLQQGVGKG